MKCKRRETRLGHSRTFNRGQRHRNHLPIIMKSVLRASLLALLTACASLAVGVAERGCPDHVDLTWMSVTNMYFDFGTVGVLADGYVSRIPKDNFYGPGGGLGQTHTPSKPDSVAVARMLGALGGASKVNVLLTGHSHFDHSFDTAVWSTTHQRIASSARRRPATRHLRRASHATDARPSTAARSTRSPTA